jgi:alanine racemase
MSTVASCLPSVPSATQDFSPAAIDDAPLEAAVSVPKGKPPRPAWVEIDLDRLRRNFALICNDKPASLQVLSVVKDDGYGHGASPVASAALSSGATCLALSTVEEAVKLRELGIRVPMLLLGDRQESELTWCMAYNLTCCVSEPHTVRLLARLAEKSGRRLPVHLKVNTGMNRYGVRWDEAPALAAEIASNPTLILEGVLSHFAQSDEADKTFARCQLARFHQAVDGIHRLGIPLAVRHLCNSGGFLDLPEAWFDMVRLGILPLGVFPSSVCRRIPGIEPVMSIKARVAAFQKLQPGDTVGYGMRFTADIPRRIAVLPIGYGDGFPRVRNQGFALIRGRRAPLVGGVAMDALTVDVTDIPETELWDEAVLMGRQGNEEIGVHEMARLRNSVSYDVLTSWRGRLPRIYVG